MSALSIFFSTQFYDSKSKSRNVRGGVPQGAVTSPVLFNFYLAGLPRLPPGISIIQYADDISIYACGKDIQRLSQAITDYVKLVKAFLDERELKVSAEKSTVTLFTPSTHEFNVHPDVRIDDEKIRLEKTPKVLGVVFDTMHTFSHHVKSTVSKAKTKLNIIKALAGTSWGQDQETMVLTYKSVCRSVLEYASPVWSPHISPSNTAKLQSIQNHALRAATGCHRMASVDHIHQETKVLPVKEHTEMVAKQYLATCFNPKHPGNKQLNKPRDPRVMKTTINMYKDQVADLLGNVQQPDDTIIKAAQKTIHSESVADTTSNLAPNRVLGILPPEINQEILTLDRTTRSELSQLRSGFSKRLNSYLHRLDASIPDECPDCLLSPHDTAHLFACRANPTVLTPDSLWSSPVEAANFLKLEFEPPPPQAPMRET